MEGHGYFLSLKRYVCYKSVDHSYPPHSLINWQATERLLSDPLYNHEYLPITGLPEFTSAAAKLILGPNSPAIVDGRVASVQTVSGTGANHLAALFLSRFYNFNGPKQVFLSNPTWSKQNVHLSSCVALRWA